MEWTCHLYSNHHLCPTCIAYSPPQIYTPSRLVTLIIGVPHYQVVVIPDGTVAHKCTNFDLKPLWTHYQTSNLIPKTFSSLCRIEVFTSDLQKIFTFRSSNSSRFNLWTQFECLHSNLQTQFRCSRSNLQTRFDDQLFDIHTDTACVNSSVQCTLFLARNHKSALFRISIGSG